MCGIVGYLGPNNGVDIVLAGLKLLEYRGYDSAGVCFKNGDELTLFKKAGPLSNLESFLERVNHSSHLCIGHTRWATHGEVSDVNAHPHLDDSFAIVHNGIIENSNVLKAELMKDGIKFVSETDSEIFLRLVIREYKKCSDFFKAVTESFKMVHGNSAFFVINRERDEIIALKRGAPLVCGLNSEQHEAYASSDPYALVGRVETLYFPQDEVVCYLKYCGSELISFYELSGENSSRYKMQKQDMSEERATKGEYEHYMLKEINEQPVLIRSLATYYTSGSGASALKEIKFDSVNHIHIIGCGTAWHAGLLIKKFLEHGNKIPCTVDLASEFRYGDPLIKHGDVGLFISQSGETADTLAAQLMCKKSGIKTVSIVNVEGSSIFRECDHNLLIKAGMEIGVASTKAFTQQVLTGYLMSRSIIGELSAKLLNEKFGVLAHEMESVLSKADKIKEVAEAIHRYKGFIFTGRGKYFAVALEGALKLKEIAYVHAEGYAAGELKHGPIALIDKDMINIAIVGPELYDKTVSNIEEVKARKGVIVIIGPSGDESLMKLSDFYIPINYERLDDLSPLLVNLVNQLLSYYMAKFKGTDIDRPRNLAKSVTVE